MSLAPGTRLGPYEVTAQIGAGGMGEVYRARDTKLNRDVAIKVLPQSVAADPERLARFHREAQVLASLNHPNIAHVYGVEDSSRTHALVMELVEGLTLADRIARGPISLDEALPIAKQIAEALEAAHEQGVIHRDLKPANIKVRDDGTVKVLDFGLAKLVDPVAASSSSNPSVTASPTITTPAMMTGVGVILGTAAYMSPEQARGRPVDTRTDLWAFGCVLYEMLSGRQAFESGDTVSDAVAAVLRADVNWDALPAETPPSVRRLLRRCLEKERARRFHSAADARLEIDDARAEPAKPVAVSTPAPSRIRERLAWASAVIFAVVAGGAVAWAVRIPIARPPETRLDVSTTAVDDPTSFAISPDGQRIVFTASENGVLRLWLRPLDTTTAQPLAGTDGAEFPFWSPDSRSVAFFADNQLKRLDLGGGLPRVIAESAGARGGAWNADGVIVFSPTVGPLERVSSTGGQPSPITKLASGQSGHRFPHFLPDGRQFLFYSRGQNAVAGLYLGSLDSPTIKRLATADSTGVFATPNWIAFVRQGTLFAQPFDPARMDLVGNAIAIADQVASNQTTNAAAFSVSATGTIAYRRGGATVTQFTWFDRSGKVVGTIGDRDPNGLLQPMLSPDGTRVAAYRTVQTNQNIWLFDRARTIRFTVDSGREAYPLWSPDGTRIVFSKDTRGSLDLYVKASNGAGKEELLLASRGYNFAPQAWSPDGRFLLYLERNPDTGADIWVLPLDGKQKPYPFVNSRFEERSPQFSPDGHWVAYASDQSGRYEVYLRPFPEAGGEWPVSTMGGVQARWRHDGKEIFYLAPDGKLMATPVTFTRQAPELGTPVVLFQAHTVYGGTLPIGIGSQYDVAPDGRLLMNVNLTEMGTAPITVIQNWSPKN